MSNTNRISLAERPKLLATQAAGNRTLRGVGIEMEAAGRIRGESGPREGGKIAQRGGNERERASGEAGEKGPKAVFVRQLTLLGLPEPVREYVFAKPRRWRFDFCWPDKMIAVEYQGIHGARNSSHASVGSLMRDYRKFTEASLRGWTLILIDANSVRLGDAVAWVERAFQGKGKTK